MSRWPAQQANRRPRLGSTAVGKEGNITTTGAVGVEPSGSLTPTDGGQKGTAASGNVGGAVEMADEGESTPHWHNAIIRVQRSFRAKLGQKRGTERRCFC